MTVTDPNLDTLARAEPETLKQFAETLIADLGEIEVLHSRTGLVMLPMRDTAKGVAFHLGEVLVSQAHIRAEGHEAYGLRRGHDLEAAMAMALVDLALLRGIRVSECTAFCAQAAAEQAQADRARLSRIEATRVNMETF